MKLAAGAALAATNHRIDEQKADAVRFRPPQRSSACFRVIQTTPNHTTRVHEISAAKIIRRDRPSWLTPAVLSER